MTVQHSVGDLSQLTKTLRYQRPLIHNITNRLMRTRTAEAINACGGTQMTVDDEDEAEQLAGLASALIINSATPTQAWQRAATQATHGVGSQGKRWVLDPVAVGVTERRTTVNRELIHAGPAVIKGNASEILALADTGSGGHGPDNQDSTDAAVAAAAPLARSLRCVIIVSGQKDAITDGSTLVHVTNGAPVMGRMVGSGCMLGAVVGCYLATTANALQAAVASVLHFNVSGEIAAHHSSGPGSLYPALIDALAAEDGSRMVARSDITIDSA